MTETGEGGREEEEEEQSWIQSVIRQVGAQMEVFPPAEEKLTA